MEQIYSTILVCIDLIGSNRLGRQTFVCSIPASISTSRILCHQLQGLWWSHFIRRIWVIWLIGHPKIQLVAIEKTRRGNSVLICLWCRWRGTKEINFCTTLRVHHSDTKIHETVSKRRPNCPQNEHPISTSHPSTDIPRRPTQQRPFKPCHPNNNTCASVKFPKLPLAYQIGGLDRWPWVNEMIAAFACARGGQRLTGRAFHPLIEDVCWADCTCALWGLCMEVDDGALTFANGGGCELWVRL